MILLLDQEENSRQTNLMSRERVVREIPDDDVLFCQAISLLQSVLQKQSDPDHGRRIDQSLDVIVHAARLGERQAQRQNLSVRYG